MMRTLLIPRSAALWLCASIVFVHAQSASAQDEPARLVGERYDVVVRGGRVMDPESGLDAILNVGIRDGTIAVLSAGSLQGDVVLDAEGLVVSPGFIDADSFLENARFQVTDGVTTLLDLRQGTADVERWYAEREGKALVNHGVSVGYQRVRMAVMGEAGSLERERTSPSAAERAAILRRLERSLDEGAVALGMGRSGVLDPAGWELVDACRVAAEADAHVVAAIRDDIWSESNATGNLLQILGAAAVSGAAVHLPHLGSSAGPHTPDVLRLMALARESGLDVTAEDYPYRAAVEEVSAGEMAEWSDQMIGEIQPIGFAERLTRETAALYADRDFEAIFHNDAIEPFVRALVESPLVYVASHASSPEWTRTGLGHPRTAGTFSRVLGHYVRGEKALTLMEALRKMALMPAQRLEDRVPAMKKKGRVQVGADADLVVFDPNRVIDRATFQEPTLSSEGIVHVLVNGVAVVKDEILLEGVYPGQPVRAPLQADD